MSPGAVGGCGWGVGGGGEGGSNYRPKHIEEIKNCNVSQDHQY